MRSQPVTTDPVQSFLSISPRPTEKFRSVIASATLMIGLAGFFLAPSEYLRPGAQPVLYVLAASTVPVALIWVRAHRPRGLEIAYVVYADVSVVITLAAFDVATVAVPACAILVLVSSFASAFASRRTLIAHLTFSCVALVAITVVAIRQGDEVWLSLARMLVLSSMFVAPVLVRMYVSVARSQIEASHRDPLTGFLTRRGLYNRVSSLYRSAQPSSTQVATIVDVAEFTELEERFGRSTGRDVVVEIAERLTAASPKGALLSRLDRSQFLRILLVDDDRGGDDAAESLRGALQSTPLRSAPATIMTGSVIEDVDARTDPGTTLHHLMARAESTMRRRHLVMNPGSTTDSAVHDRIASVIAAGGPTIVFQPMIEARGHETRGFEALSRFTGSSGSPLNWFADASTVGLRVELETCAIQAAADAARVLPPDAFVAVNASAETILSADLVTVLTTADPIRRWVVEITEHDRIEDYGGLSVAVDMLRAAGFLISVDDVGSGYSGLRQMVELRPDVVKLDASIVRGIDTDRMRRAAALSVVTFSREIGAACVFEGIETAEELATAGEVGAELVQGFYPGAPAPASALVARRAPS